MKIPFGLIWVGMYLLFSTSAFSLTIGEVSIGGVGVPDNLFYWEYVRPSNEVNELGIISEALGGVDFSDFALTKYEFDNNNYEVWSHMTDSPVGSDLWAFDFGLNFEPAYFLIKTGSKVNYDGDTFNYFLFENVGSLRYGVVDLAIFDSGIDIYKISHLSAPVPEPSTLLLLGAGIVGLVVCSRKKLI